MMDTDGTWETDDYYKEENVVCKKGEYVFIGTCNRKEVYESIR